MLKIFDLTESWQALHKENCDCFIGLVKDLSSWEIVGGCEDYHDDIRSSTDDTSHRSNHNSMFNGQSSSGFGIFQYFPLTVNMTQGTYLRKLDEKYKMILASLAKFENICDQLDIIQQEADLFYHQLHRELLSSMEGKRNEKSLYNFTIIEEYISGVREIFIMFKKEYYRYEELFQQELNYLGKSLEQIKDVYRKYSTHQYIKINRVIQVLESTEREVQQDFVDKHRFK
ncbi:hypothetical protein C9374_002644 [Naegleria lovaniensis]|uniref:Uncharacterized protein n=1 Tax=Naegleria lovaniensis TaxID=51637 RepID=A0AA88KKX6_NAELO|nr:uncharacterized protein C9374_002644 [Naegleria lovaniensis]KAG2386198.1 hypothetical protein C9374_002644 [Naegleria lovaniensis]